MEVPILLLAWRRPQTLRKVIAAIRPAAPTRLFVACDGPNLERNGEAEKVVATRAVIEREIDWPCNIERFYSDVNQGCRIGVSRAITWFFEHVEEGIILEDDCLPSPAFLDFCSFFLDVYRVDTRVASIGGHNPISSFQSTGDVVFSKYFECWGWATWRRAWKFYDNDLGVARLYDSQSKMLDFFLTENEAAFWSALGRRLLETDSPSSWAYRFQICCAAQNMVHAISSVSLVENIGFGPDGTNCKLPIPASRNQALNSITLLSDPDGITRYKVEPTPLPSRSFDRSFASLHGISFHTIPFYAKLSRAITSIRRLFQVAWIKRLLRKLRLQTSTLR